MDKFLIYEDQIMLWCNFKITLLILSISLYITDKWMKRDTPEIVVKLK